MAWQTSLGLVAGVNIANQNNAPYYRKFVNRSYTAAVNQGGGVKGCPVQFVLREDSAFEVEDITGMDEAWTPVPTAPHPLGRYRDPLAAGKARLLA